MEAFLHAAISRLCIPLLHVPPSRNSNIFLAFFLAHPTQRQPFFYQGPSYLRAALQQENGHEVYHRSNCYVLHFDLRTLHAPDLALNLRLRAHVPVPDHALRHLYLALQGSGSAIGP